MRINPLNVVNLLLAYFQTLNIPKSETNYKEIQLSERILSILIDSMNEFNGIDMIVEDTLDFQEDYKAHDVQIVEDEVNHHIPDFPEVPTDQCTEDREDVSFEYKQRAVEYWRSGKKGKI